MYFVSIDDDECVGCGACADGCPAHILAFDSERSKAYVSGDEGDCLGCEACVTVCPSGAVTVTEM